MAATSAGRERDISSLSLPADVAATRIRLIPAADVDTSGQGGRKEKKGYRLRKTLKCWDRLGYLPFF